VLLYWALHFQLLDGDVSRSCLALAGRKMQRAKVLGRQQAVVVWGVEQHLQQR